MIEAIQVAAMNPRTSRTGAASSAQSPQASAYDVREFAASLERTGGAPTQAANPATLIDLTPPAPPRGHARADRRARQPQRRRRQHQRHVADHERQHCRYRRPGR